jgi:predicted RNA binding protein YcfA (HicA-like mRNA interferase family)
MKVKEAIKMIERDGWYLERQKGSHMQFKHPTKKGIVTIASHKLSDDIAKGTLASIFKQAQIIQSK